MTEGALASVGELGDEARRITIASSTIDACILFVVTEPATKRDSEERGVLDERAASEGLLLALLGQRAMRRLRAAHAEHGLSPRQFQVLGVLRDQGAMTQGELGGVWTSTPASS